MQEKVSYKVYEDGDQVSVSGDELILIQLNNTREDSLGHFSLLTFFVDREDHEYEYEEEVKKLDEDVKVINNFIANLTEIPE